MTDIQSVRTVVPSSGGSADGTTVRAGAHDVAPRGTEVPIWPTVQRAHGSPEGTLEPAAAATSAPARTIDPRYSPAVLLEDREERIAQQTYRQHLAIEAAEREQLRKLRHERESGGRHEDESERYYTALGVLVEQNVRGLLREWRAAQ